MELLKALPFCLKDETKIQLDAFEEEEDSEVLKTVFADLEENKARKVIFVIKKPEDVERLLMIKKELQRRLALGKDLPQCISKYDLSKGDTEDLNNDIWPSNWMTAVYFSNFPLTKEEISYFFERIDLLPNVESIYIYTRHKLQVPSCIGKLKRLKSFTVHADLRTLPTTMRYCQELEEMKVNYNRLERLPFWITKLKKLKVLWKQDNILIVQTSADPERVEIKETQTDEGKEVKNTESSKSPKSLFHLASVSLLVTFPCLLSSEMCNDLPKTIVDDLAFLQPNIKFCDVCSGGFVRNNYTVVRKTFASFNGYAYIPFEAVVCSEPCADAIYNEFTTLAQKEKELDSKQETCFHNYAIPHYSHCRYCRGGRFRFLKKLSCFT